MTTLAHRDFIPGRLIHGPLLVDNGHTVQFQRPFDPVVTFRNSQGEAARGTLTSLQRRSLVMEVYNPYSIVQVSEVLGELTIRSGDRIIYKGKAVVVSLLNTGLMAVISVALIDEWSDLNAIKGNIGQVRDEAFRFVSDWESRFRIRESYQVTISEFRAFLSETARWIDGPSASASGIDTTIPSGCWFTAASINWLIATMSKVSGAR